VFTEESKDIILKLIKLKPDERLGAGPANSNNALDRLIGHPFF